MPAATFSDVSQLSRIGKSLFESALNSIWPFKPITHTRLTGKQATKIDGFREAILQVVFDLPDESKERIMAVAATQPPAECPPDEASRFGPGEHSDAHRDVGTQPFVTAGDEHIAPVSCEIYRSMTEGLSSIHGYEPRGPVLVDGPTNRPKRQANPIVAYGR